MAKLQTTEIIGRLIVSEDIYANSKLNVNGLVNIDNFLTLKSGTNNVNGKDSVGLMVGDGASLNLSINSNTIQSRNNGTAGTLFLNAQGGIINFGDGSKNNIAANGIATFTSVSLLGVPTAPTPAIGSNTTQIANTAFVKSEINSVLSNNDAMIFKGVIAAGTNLPIGNCGDTYKVSSVGVISGIPVEIGDMLICSTDNTPANTPANWTILQTNIDGAVTGPVSSVNNTVALFNGTSGKLIKDSGHILDPWIGANTIATRTNEGDLAARLFKSTYVDNTLISGGIAYRVNNGNDSFIRFCNDMGAVRTFVSVYSKAESDSAYATITTAQTLTNKTLTSPILTGGPIAPTAAAGNNSSQISTTEFVQRELYASLLSPALRGTPTTPTATVGTNTTQIANTAFVKAEINSTLAAANAMIFKGVIAAGATLPAANCGDTYKVSSSGVINGINVDIGDMLICTTDSTAAGTPANWNIIQSNIDGAVTGPASSINNTVPLFNGTSGKIIKDSGITVSLLETGSTIAQRDANGDLALRLVKSSFHDDPTIEGSIAYRVNNTDANYIKFCSDMGAVRTFVSVYSKAESDSAYATISTAQTLTNKTLVSPMLTGQPTVSTVSPGSNSNRIASTEFVQGEILSALVSPALSGTPTAPTAVAGTNTTQIANTAYVKTEINNVIAANDAMLFKGTIAAGATLPIANCGDTYKVASNGVIGGYNVKTGDIFICTTDNTPVNTPANWTVIQTNLDGAVIGPASSEDNSVVLFNGNSGRLIKDGGIQLSEAVHPLTIPKRNDAGDINARLFKSTYVDEAPIRGGMAFRVNNSTDNYIRFCNNKTNIQTFLNVIDKSVAVDLTSTQTLTNKTLTDPIIRDILSPNGRVSVYGADHTVAQGIIAGDLTISSAHADASKVPTNGIYSKGDVRIGDCTLSYDSTTKALKFKFV